MRPPAGIRAAVIAVGTELIEDGRPDTNGTVVSRYLASKGVETALRVQVGDDEEEIAAELLAAEGRFPIVIVTGGLGPTVDDVTRQAVSRAFGLDLIEDARVLEGIAERYRARGREMSPWAARQALVPRGGEVLPNAAGTAPGLLLRRPGGTVVVLLPGVPHEMETMMRDEVLARIETVAGAGVGTRGARVLKVSGLTELEVQGRILDLIEDRRPHEPPALTLLASPAEITVIVRGGDPARVEEIVRLARARLGEHVFADRLDVELESEVGRLFTDRRLSLACAESCTGGLLGALLTRVPGASGWFRQGWVTYSNEAKRTALEIDPALIERQGAVSAEVAEAMARAARRLSGADVAVGITGIAGPQGGTDDKPVGLVYIAVATPLACRVTRHQFPGDREMIRLFAARTAMNRVRLEAP